MAVTRKCQDCGADTIDGECLPCLLQLGLPETTELASAALPLPLPLGGEGAAPKPPESGERQFGDYVLLQELARGGMGVIFKARQVSLRRLVAIKMILGGRLAGDAEVQRFRIELLPPNGQRAVAIPGTLVVRVTSTTRRES